ncbi:MAG: hypothetical protein E7403_07555 [Ruminococcaceae bacterium]|nr:hypothetical protein [Oscillospiraceae bacterium]
MSTLKIGWSEVNITPDKKVSLVGQFAERISQYVEKPLTATALAVDNGDDYVIFCSLDLVNAAWNLIVGVREKLVEKKAPFDPEKVIIGAIHTHTGPGYGATQRPNMGKGKDPIGTFREMLKSYLAPGQKYVEKEDISTNPEIATMEENYTMLVEKISQVILEAWENRKEGSFSNAFGRVAVGMCRRAAYSDDTAQMWGDTNTAVFTELEGGNDSGVELLYVFDEKEELSGVVVNLACPAQCVQHRLFVSPDFWGEVKMLLRKRFGDHIFMLPQCSAAGDQCPVDLVRWVEPESDINDPNCLRNNPPKRKADPSMFDLSGMRLVGRRIANEIIAVYEDGLDAPQKEVVLEHRVLDMQLPIRRATLTDVKNAEKGIMEYLQRKTGDVDYNDVANLQVHLGVIKRSKIQETLDCLDTEIHIVRLGSVAFATNPFELFLDYGNQIKARIKCEQIFLSQLTNGSEGYLPTAKAERHGHYSAFISSGQVGHEGGDLLVRQTLKNVNEMF